MGVHPGTQRHECPPHGVLKAEPCCLSQHSVVSCASSRHLDSARTLGREVAPHSWLEGNFDGDNDIDIDFNFSSVELYLGWLRSVCCAGAICFSFRINGRDSVRVDVFCFAANGISKVSGCLKTEPPLDSFPFEFTISSW